MISGLYMPPRDFCQLFKINASECSGQRFGCDCMKKYPVVGVYTVHVHSLCTQTGSFLDNQQVKL